MQGFDSLAPTPSTSSYAFHPKVSETSFYFQVDFWEQEDS